jgi:hypothetical protein
LYRITPIAIKFFAEHYFTEKSKNLIDEIAVRFLSTSYTQEQDTIAYCDFTPEDDGVPTSFDLVFNNNLYRDVTYKHYLTTVFHELTHADQYMSGRLKCVSPRNGLPYFVWNKKRYYDDSDYWKEPWEIEAYGTETCAYSKFVATYPELGLRKYKSVFNGRGALAMRLDDKIDLIMKRGKK